MKQSEQYNSKMKKTILVKWLNSKGGRTMEDIVKDPKNPHNNRGRYIMMWSSLLKDYVRVYLPYSEQMKKELNQNKRSNEKRI